MVNRLASTFALTACALAFTAMSPACGGGAQGNGFESNASGHHGSGTGDDGTGDDGGAGGGGNGGPSGGLNPGSGGGGGVSPDAGCATATAAAKQAPGYLVIVLDGSGSMKEDSKWDSAKAALDAIFADMGGKKDPSLGVGLIVFSDKNDPTCGGGTFGGAQCTGPYPSNVDVPIALVDGAQAGKLSGRIDNSAPNDGTPTHAALQGGWSEVEQFTPQAPLLPDGKKVVVIVTDGVPTDDCSNIAFTGGNPQNCYNDAKAELAKGISTFVVGVGPFPSTNTQNYDPSFLGQLAQSGGAATAGCNANETSDPTKLCYFQVTPGGNQAALTKQFEDAIRAILGQIASCDFTLDKVDGGSIDPNEVNVVFTDANGDHTIPQDPANGWTYDNPSNPSKVILHGNACTSLRSSAKAKITIVLGCATVKTK